MFKLIFTSMVLAVCLSACVLFKDSDVESRSVASESGAELSTDYPWEISNDRGETYLTDIYYSSDFQNEQIIPTTVKDILTGKMKNGVNRIIYPTLGNPNLFVKNDQYDKDDSVSIVMRIEERIWKQLSANLKLSKKLSSSVEKYEFSQNLFNSMNLTKPYIQTYIRSKSQRTNVKKTETCQKLGTDSGAIFSIKPSEILVKRSAADIVRGEVAEHEIGYYEALNHDASLLGDSNGGVDKKITVEFRYNKNTLTNVCAGLYDIQVHMGYINPQNKLSVVIDDQYNALRVFDEIPNHGNYTIINVTDTQITIERKVNDLSKDDDLEASTKKISGTISEKIFEFKTHNKLKEFVKFVNEKVRDGSNPLFSNAAFISFNGDLHNGGSPTTLQTKSVIETYNREAQAIFNLLKELDLPLFLTIGNHDGYAAVVAQLTDQKNWKNDLNEFIKIERKNEIGMKISATEWALKNKVIKTQFKLDNIEAYPNFESLKGGNHVDIFAGSFASRFSQKMSEVYRPIPQDKKNLILYDGFNQWRKTYGPMSSSFRFGRNYFVNMNTYELRQHRRTGWGMYTVNYGGGMSQMQMQWVRRQVAKAEKMNLDIVLLSHHDPRGGHKGEDYPYYYKQLDFKGMGQSLGNFVMGSVLNPIICKIPDEYKSTYMELNCMHDGLQEWMRPDPEFDCKSNLLLPNGKCDLEKMKTQKGLTPIYSGYQLLDLIATTPAIRTVILGHTHFNSYEFIYNDPSKNSEQPLVKNSFIQDSEQVIRKKFDLFYELENTNIMRQSENFKSNPVLDKLSFSTDMKQEIEYFKALFTTYTPEEINLKSSGHTFESNLKGNDRELVFLRMTTLADLTTQKINSKSMMGFSVFEVNSKYNSRPQINKVHYYQYIPGPLEQAKRDTIIGEKLSYIPEEILNIFGEATFSRIKYLDINRKTNFKMMLQ